MTGNQLREQYGVSTHTILTYMKNGLKAVEPNHQRPVLDRGKLKSAENIRRANLVEMARHRGRDRYEDIRAISTDPAYDKFHRYHYVSFDWPDTGEARDHLIEEVDRFVFDNQEFLRYHATETIAAEPEREIEQAAIEQVKANIKGGHTDGIDYVLLFNEGNRCYDLYKDLEREDALSLDEWARKIDALNLCLIRTSDIQGIQLHQAKRHKARNIQMGILKNAVQRISGKKITIKEFSAIKNRL